MGWRGPEHMKEGCQGCSPSFEQGYQGKRWYSSGSGVPQIDPGLRGSRQ
jgi:hypothetical protein